MPSEADDWEDYESGPFCPHWNGLGDCDEKCSCGHRCGTHLDECGVDDCACEGFKEPESDDGANELIGKTASGELVFAPKGKES